MRALFGASRSAAILAGVAVGQLLVVVLDRMVGGPGPLALFGF